MPFYNIHQTQEVQNNNRIINLGGGTNFDIKTLLPDVDYESLTVDNFIIVGSEVTGTLECWAEPRNSGVTSGAKTGTIWYAPTYENGVLNVQVNIPSEVGASASGSSGNSANARMRFTATKAPVCYLVVGSIETL